MVTIQVISQQTGKPWHGCKVSVYMGASLGLYTEHTDSGGEAHFTKVDPGEYEFYVDGKTHKGRLEGRKVVYA